MGHVASHILQNKGEIDFDVKVNGDAIFFFCCDIFSTSLKLEEDDGKKQAYNVHDKTTME